jgi:hypothetical protein
MASVPFLTNLFRLPTFSHFVIGIKLLSLSLSLSLSQIFLSFRSITQDTVLPFLLRKGESVFHIACTPPVLQEEEEEEEEEEGGRRACLLESASSPY